MPAVFNKDGTATAYGLSVSPFTGWQHGRIDSSAIAHVASFARRSCQVAGWIDISPYRDPTRTTFAVAHEVRVNSQYASRFIQVTDKCYAICTVSHVGNSSCSFLTKVYLSPKNVVEPTEDQLKERDYHDWMMSKSSEGGATEGPVELGMTTLTLVYISTETRKSITLHEGLRKMLEDGSQNKSLTSDWKVRGNNDRLKINFGLMTSAAAKFFLALEESALVFSAASASLEGNILPITNINTSSSSANNHNVSVPQVDILTSLKGLRANSEESAIKHLAIFSSRRALRPADFDFNLHMNMNMYVSSVLDTLKYAMRDFLDLQRKQQSVASNNQHSDGSSPDAEKKPKERGTPIVTLDYQFPVSVMDMPEDKKKNNEGEAKVATSAVEAASVPDKVTIHHLGEVLGRLGYQSVVSKFTTRSHSNRLNVPATEPQPQEEDYLSRQTSSPIPTASASSAAETNDSSAPKRDAYDMTRFVSVEECVLSSRIEYHMEVTELTSELEITVMIAPPATSGEGSPSTAHIEKLFSVDPDTLRVSENQQDHPNLPIHYLIRCIPPSWVSDPTSYIASSGEIVLRPVDSLPIYLPVLSQEIADGQQKK
eukprot:GILI01011262.1.p1 GENE.GILI01011262.1~~GILI01011262.1.p1  ORF type:complete len:598 (+),score=104.18 GILI01011262.1:26-1819(+)